MKTTKGSSTYLGARLTENGVNFALFSKNATAVSLVLFGSSSDRTPYQEIHLVPTVNKSGDIWHIFIEELTSGCYYGYRVDGPGSLKAGHSFNRDNYLLDPYARAITDLHGIPKGIVISDYYDWEDVPRPRIPWDRTIIYETHLKGFTRHDSSGVKYPGTYKGAIEKIPYLKELGITAVEFLPVFEFNHSELEKKNPLTGEMMGNYWGYSTIGFFSPKASYAVSGDTGGQVEEFREMVKEFHRAGIEVILDVVFNHTAEMGHVGPVYSFRGIDNLSYYLLQQNRRRYLNLTGCGNTVYCNNPPVIRFILDCLRYWVSEMGVDGFRFDLATIFNRKAKAQWLDDPPILRVLGSDPVLRETKMIAEAWDPAGGYQVGSFGDNLWHDWNDKFRDGIRRFWRGDKNSTGEFASRLSGSQDHFDRKKNPLNSVNFITAHDGFTLNDLVSYKRKHNRANGHKNRDGSAENFSQNFGVEGITDNPAIKKLRATAVKSYLATLFLSQGTPMLLGGDEFLRSQQGNNNAYRQDNDISWFNWNLVADNQEIFRFCSEMIKLRQKHPVFRRNKFFTGAADVEGELPDILWFDQQGNPHDWNENKRQLGCYLNGREIEYDGVEDDNDFYLLFNSELKKCIFGIPSTLSEKKWQLLVNSGNDSPGDILSKVGKSPLIDKELPVAGGAVVVLIEM